MAFQLCVVLGILIAQSINVGTSQIQPYGWRISLGLAAVPGFILLMGGLFLPETPNSLIERGYLQQVGSAYSIPETMLRSEVPTWSKSRPVG